MKRQFNWLVLGILMFVGCQGKSDRPRKVTPHALEANNGPARESSGKATPKAAAKNVDEAKGVDVLAEALAMNADHRMAPAEEFHSGHVTPRKLAKDAIKRTKAGFTIHLPSEAPVPTPTVYQGRLYVSGGFSSKEYYCFNAETGALVWAVDLDDDGPSSAVASDDTIIFGTESCTLFAMDAKTGRMLWSYWLGDPLMSTPTVANGQVFTVYPAEYPGGLEQREDANPAGAEKAEQPGGDTKPAGEKESPKTWKGSEPAQRATPTHVLACFQLKTGKVLWQRWIDGDCLSAPIASENEIFVTTLAGTLYSIRQADGEILAARRIRATSAPVVAGNRVFVTRRADDPDKREEVFEAIAKYDRKTVLPEFVASRRAAPYLNRRIQEMSEAASAAGKFEASNGILGGFGGGFGGSPQPCVPTEGPWGFAELMSWAQKEPPSKKRETDNPTDDVRPMDGESSPPHEPNQAPAESDPLAAQQQMAADLIGQGNVSTLQGFQGSRLLYWNSRNYNCMGDLLVCSSTESGKTLWSHKLRGDLAKIGGHLAAPPVAAGGQLFLATFSGEVLQFDPAGGRIRATYKVGAPIRFPPIVEGGRIYVGTQDGRLVCIDTGNRQLTGWPMWGGNAAHTATVR